MPVFIEAPLKFITDVMGQDGFELSSLRVLYPIMLPVSPGSIPTLMTALTSCFFFTLELGLSWPNLVTLQEFFKDKR